MGVTALDRDLDTDPKIEDIAALNPTDGDMLYWGNATVRYELTPSTGFGRGLLNLAGAAALAAIVGSTLISDSITNGVVDLAPSQNAVFDALALKMDNVAPTFTGGIIGTGRAEFKSAGDVFGVGVRYNDSGGIVYFGATNSATPNAVISNNGGSAIATFKNDRSVQLNAYTAGVMVSDASGNLTASTSYLTSAQIAAAYQPLDTDLTAWAAVNPSSYSTTAQIAAAYQPIDTDLTSWAAITRAAGFDAFVATPSSVNLKALLTDDTGSGAAVFATAPTLSAPTITNNVNAVATEVLAYSGQSNAGTVERSYSWTPPANLQVWNGAAFAAPSGTVISSVLSWAAQRARENPARQIRLVGASFGGVPISAWLPSGNTMWTALETNVEAALAALSLTTIDRFFWWQGDADYASLTYQADFETFVARLRGEPWFPHSTPIVLVGITEYLETGDQAALAAFNTNLAQLAAAESEFRSYVHASSLPTAYWTSGVGELKAHMTAAGYDLVGKMVNSAHDGIVKGRGKMPWFTDPYTLITKALQPWVMAAALTVQGAFTSIGIDDNATAERVQIADTLLTLGPSGAAGYTIAANGNTGALVFDGGSTGSNGATVSITGASHATLPSLGALGYGGTPQVSWGIGGLKAQVSMAFGNDANFTLSKPTSTAAVLSFDALDGIGYDQSANTMSFTIGGANPLALSATAATFIVPATITKTGGLTLADSALQLISTDATTLGPVLGLYHNSASPAANDALARINIFGNNSSAAAIRYASLSFIVTDPTAGSEDSRIAIATVVAGTLANRLNIVAGIYTQNATGGDQGIDTINASNFFDDGVNISAIYAPQANPTFTGTVSLPTGTTVGAGGTGVTAANLIINGSSAAGVGPTLTFSANSVAKNIVGAYSAIFGGAHDDDLSFYALSDHIYMTRSAVKYEIADAGNVLTLSNKTLASPLITGAATTVGASAVAHAILHAANNSSVTLNGGSTITNSAGVNLFGGSHATLAGAGILYSASTNALAWSASAVTCLLPLVTPTKTPASAGAAGTAGEWAWDSSYIYICTATNTWKRVAIATW